MCCGGNIQGVPISIPKINGKKPKFVKFRKSVKDGIAKIGKKVGTNKKSKTSHS